MLKHVIKITFLLSYILFITACKKYEDGPAFSLITKKARLSNIWKVDTYYLNGKDKTTQYRGLVTREKLIIFQSGEFEYTEVSSWLWATPQYTGKWKLVNNKEYLEMTPDNSIIPIKTCRILRLKNKQLWLEERVSADSLVEYHYLPYSGE